MNPFSFVRSLPQPLKTLYASWIVGVFVAVILGVTTENDVAIAPLGVIAILTGLTLVTNFRGGTSAMARVMKTYRPWGIDYSGSFLATTAYCRAFGALAILVGGGFLYGAVTSR